jgi:hypothetical protein
MIMCVPLDLVVIRSDEKFVPLISAAFNVQRSTFVANSPNNPRKYNTPAHSQSPSPRSRPLWCPDHTRHCRHPLRRPKTRPAGAILMTTSVLSFLTHSTTLICSPSHPGNSQLSVSRLKQTLAPISQRSVHPVHPFPHSPVQRHSNALTSLKRSSTRRQVEFITAGLRLPTAPPPSLVSLRLDCSLCPAASKCCVRRTRNSN